MEEVSRFFEAAKNGDPKAAEDLLPVLYRELRSLAASKMAREEPGQTLQPTALVHEAWLRLAENGNSNWAGCSHFFAAAAEAMRRVLVDRARSRNRKRHGGGLKRVDFAQLDVAATDNDDAVLAVSELLDELAVQDPVGAELIKLRFFAGLPNIEAARMLGIPERTAKRHWAYSRAWLFRELKKDGGAP